MFANRLKELRTNAHLSQNELSDILGVAQQTVASWEKGNSSPSYEILCKLADYFRVTSDFLLGRVNNSNEAYIPVMCHDYDYCKKVLEREGIELNVDHDGKIRAILGKNCNEDLLRLSSLSQIQLCFPNKTAVIDVVCSAETDAIKSVFHNTLVKHLMPWFLASAVKKNNS